MTRWRVMVTTWVVAVLLLGLSLGYAIHPAERCAVDEAYVTHFDGRACVNVNQMPR